MTIIRTFLSIFTRNLVDAPNKKKVLHAYNLTKADLEGVNISSGCVLCKLNIKYTYKDIPLISQFLRQDGSLMSRRQNGLCKLQHRRLEKIYARAKQTGLLDMKTFELKYGHIKL